MVLCIVGAVFAALMVLRQGLQPVRRGRSGRAALRPQPAAAAPRHGAASAGAVHRLRGPLRAVRLRHLDAAARPRRQDLGRPSQKWAVAGWLFLSLGIGLGAWWAYVVLSFGGYWAWDPVENTSLVPWLTATALLHAFTLYKSRGLFKRWALGSGRGDVLLHHPRHVDDAHRPHPVGARVRKNDAPGLDPLRVPRRHGRGQRRPHGLALAPLRESRPDRVPRLARLPLLPHQPAAHAVRRRPSPSAPWSCR